MLKKLLPVILLLPALLLTSCASANSGVTQTAITTQSTTISTSATTVQTTQKTTQTTAPIQDPASDFQVLDKSSFCALYYLNYTEDYKFDEFIASGGASSTRELVEYAYKAFPGIKLDLSALGYGCSSFCAQSNDGDIIFGRNFDMSSDYSGSYLIVHTAPENGYESYSTVNLKFLGVTSPEKPTDTTSPLSLAPYVPLDGINSAGLAICVLQLNFPEIHQNGAATDMTSTTIIRNVLDNAATVEEAIEIFNKCNINTDGYAYHYMVGDASGKSAVIEFVNNEMTVSYKTEDVQVCANTYVTEAGMDFYKDTNAADSLNRMNAIVSSVRASDFDLTVEASFKALKAASNNNTRWSIVYNLTEKTMSFVANKNFDKIFSFSFSK